MDVIQTQKTGLPCDEMNQALNEYVRVIEGYKVTKDGTETELKYKYHTEERARVKSVDAG